LVAQLIQALEHPRGRFHLGQIVGSSESVNVNQVQTIGLQALQAAFENTHGRVPIAFRNFGGQPDFRSSRSHHFPDPFFALAVSIGVRGVHIGDALIQRAIECRYRLIVVRIRKKPAAASEGQDRDPCPGASQYALRHAMFGRRHPRCGKRGQGCGRLYKFAA